MLVRTPAGSGKTVLLADWARCAQRPVAWLPLGAGDNDPARFWRHPAAALDGLCPGFVLQPNAGDSARHPLSRDARRIAAS